MKINNPYMDGSRILLGGHRGDRKHYPENTMPAMRAAVEMGCDAIETDVRRTRDGHLVLIHDRDVARTTNGHGNVDEMTLEELRALDAGAWKDPAFAGTRIPTVEEFLDYVQDKNTVINWELKEYPKELGEEWAYGTIDRLVELIDRYGMAERSMINSFSELDLEYVANKWPGKFAIHGYLHYNRPKDRTERELASFCHWVAIWNKTADHPAGFEKDYDEARAHDILACILVQDVEEQYAAALALGCRMFTSDDPKKALEILRGLGVR